jgi:hypothetical protein
MNKHITKYDAPAETEKSFAGASCHYRSVTRDLASAGVRYPRNRGAMNSGGIPIPLSLTRIKVCSQVLTEAAHGRPVGIHHRRASFAPGLVAVR